MVILLGYLNKMGRYGDWRWTNFQIGGGGESLLSQHPGMELYIFNPLSTHFSKWSNTLKQFVGNLPTNFWSVFGHFVGLALKRLALQLRFLHIWIHAYIVKLSLKLKVGEWLLKIIACIRHHKYFFDAYFKVAIHL